ncbi:MAG: threonylcarbamoyl-AMP synthase [Spirochaetaceae bacterium]|jgi:L-threonylcarbamoyladenylate synthase|nr:threonylcarbamoyl-AMP synthase [Spirochaetaceae bacterium]
MDLFHELLHGEMNCSTVLLYPNDTTIELAADALRRGKVVAFPTETVYGLGVDAFNPAAVASVFAAKKRPRFDPLIVHIADLAMLESVVDLEALESRTMLDKLMRNLWPGPLTVILPKQAAVPDIVTAGLSTVALRFPDHDVAQKLIRLSTGAIAAPSANLFGRLSPTRAEHVVQSLGGVADYIIDDGKTGIGLESTVLDLCSSQPCILRPGGTTQEQLEALIGPVLREYDSKMISSPGQLKSHYAPKTALHVYPLKGLPYYTDAAYLFFDGKSRDSWCACNPAAAKIYVLSESGSLSEAAANLFILLHELDTETMSAIYAQLAPEKGLGIAINDRLKRASVHG